jgi:hypothetical protein
MIGFEIWYDGNCIHEETGFADVDEMEQGALEWWYGLLEEEGDEENPSEYLVKLFDGEDSDEMTIEELMSWWYE